MTPAEFAAIRGELGLSQLALLVGDGTTPGPGLYLALPPLVALPACESLLRKVEPLLAVRDFERDGPGRADAPLESYLERKTGRDWE